MNDYSVYKHTSPNGKVYIGITCQKDPSIRWKNGWGYSRNIHFMNAIKKYGWENFAHEIIYEGLTHEEANKTEAGLINHYNSTDTSFGYNISPGGGAWSDEIRAKSSEAIKRAWANEETRSEWIKAIKRAVNTEECKALLSKKSSASWQNPEIREKILNALRASNNTDERKASRARAASEMWKDPETRARIISAIKASNGTPERRAFTSSMWRGRIDSEETRRLRSQSLKKHYESFDAKKRLSIGIKKGWEDPETKRRHAEGTERYWAENSRKVLCVETGVIYGSLRVASDATGAKRTQINSCCNKRPHYLTAGGYHWEWYNPSQEEATA